MMHVKLCCLPCKPRVLHHHLNDLRTPHNHHSYTFGINWSFHLQIEIDHLAWGVIAVNWYLATHSCGISMQGSGPGQL